MNCSNFGIYIHKNDNFDSYVMKEKPLIGLVDGDNIFKWKSYNKFETTPTLIPKNFVKLNITHYKDVLFMFCGENDETNTIKYNDSKKIFIYSVGTYYENELVFITKNNIYIHKRKINHHSFHRFIPEFWDKNGSKYKLNIYKIAKSKLYDRTLFYDKTPFVIHNYKKIFIGKDLDRSNSLLVEENNNKYIFICNVIIEFNTINNDKIIKYISNYTNGRLYPDPIAIGKKYIYMPTFKICIEKNNIPKSLLDNSDELIQYIINEKDLQKVKKDIFFDVN